MSFQIGDFIAIATLAARAFQALHSTRGSKFEYTSLLSTLEALSQAMVQAEALCIRYHTWSPDNTPIDPAHLERLNSIAHEINKELKECQALIDQFFKDFAAYNEAFVESGGGMIRQGLRKLTWIGHRDEAAILEKLLNSHMQSLQLRLSAFCYVSMKNDVVHNTSLLESIDSSIGTLTTRFSDMQLKMSETISKLELVQNSVPMSIGYCWGPEAPIQLLDGLGRKLYLPIILASSPEVLREVLLIIHRGAPGYDKIESGKYVVSDEDFGGALIPPEKWLDSFLPGRCIALSFILKLPGVGDEKQCPRCKTFKTWPDEKPGRRRCSKCFLTFKIEDQERTRLFWKDLKPRPKPLVRHSSPEVTMKRKGIPMKRFPARSQTLLPDKYAHPYRRVHYQRDVPRRTSAEQPWLNTDPEFRDFLAALPPVHRAAATGNIVKLDEVLQDVDNDSMNWKVPSHSLYRRDRTGWDFTGAPPIHFATYYGHGAAVLYLLSCGAKIDAKDAAGTTALHAAAWTGNEDLFQVLYKKGADISILDHDGWNVAVYAMSQGHDSILRLFLENSGGDEEMMVKTYKLRHTAKSGNLNAVLGILLEDQAAHGFDEPRELFLAEALFGAAEGGHEVLVQVLMEQGADPAAADNTGSTALHWAAWGGHTEIGNLMYDEKGDIDNSDGQGKDLASRMRLTSPRHESVMCMLIEKGADINAQNFQGCTPLHWVSGAGSVPMVKFLLDEGTNIDIMDNSGRTAIDRARETRDEHLMKLLQPE